MVDLEKAREEMAELKNRITSLKAQRGECEDKLKEKTTEICQATALELLGIPANVDATALVKDEPELIKERILEQKDPLIRLALAEAVGLTSVYDQGYTCCPDDNPRPYLEKMEALGLRELISRVENGYKVREEKFDEARDLLIRSFGEKKSVKEYKNLKDELEKLENTINDAIYTEDRLGKEIKLAELITGDQVSDTLREHLLEAVNKQEFSGLLVVNPDTAVYHTGRSEWGSSGGIAYFDLANVYYKGQVEQQEWQWRDRYDPDKDRRDLRFGNFGDVKIQEEENKIVIEVELVAFKEYRNRWATFKFDPVKEALPVVMLSADEQAEFSAKIKSETERIMAEKMRLWEYKPKMRASYPAGSFMPMGTPDEEPYQQPSVKPTIHLKLGIAAFLVEEQIDHRGSDPQMRYELYLLRHADDKARLIAEDHGYEREGGALLNLISLDQHSITYSVGSSDNKKTFEI